MILASPGFGASPGPSSLTSFKDAGLRGFVFCITGQGIAVLDHADLSMSSLHFMVWDPKPKPNNKDPGCCVRKDLSFPLTNSDQKG